MEQGLPEWFEPFDNKEGIIALLKDIDEELSALISTGETVSIVLVGGALMLLMEFRKMTYDIDFFLYTEERRIDITKSIRRVAEKRGLPTNWANFDVENLPIDMDRFVTKPLLNLKTLKVFAALPLSMLALKLFACMNRANKDDSDLMILKEAYPDITFEQVFSHMKEICPTEFVDEDLARDMFDPVTW